MKPAQVPPNSIGNTKSIPHPSRKVNTAYVFSHSGLVKDILKNARAAGVPLGSAEIFATRTADHVQQWIKGRAKVTEADLNRVIAKKLSSFSSDLAFFYKNNGKII